VRACKQQSHKACLSAALHKCGMQVRVQGRQLCGVQVWWLGRHHGLRPEACVRAPVPERGFRRGTGDVIDSESG
jgi:hypothetical protein